jgi:dolichyl-diphosphooligosaccharide--protein glycosyltransferase
MAYKNATNYEIGSFVKIFFVVMILFVAGATLLTGTQWMKSTSYYVTQYVPINQDNIDRFDKTNISPTDVVGATVGEENTGHQFFLQKYSFLLWVPFAALLAIIIYLFTTKKKDYITLLIFFWIAITLFMAWFKLKFTYTLGLPIAAGCGVLFYIASEWLQDKNNLSKRIFAITVGAILLISIAAGSFFVSTNVPPIDEQPDWKETVFWLKDNTDVNANIFNWWDYGHWIAYFSERKVATDNTNSFIEGDSNVAMFMITDDVNKAKEILRKYEADYIPVETDYFQRLGSFGMYAYITTNTSDPRITKYFGVALSCSSTKTEVTGIINYSCGGNTIPESEFSLLPSVWQDKPNELMQNTPVYI